jgi:nucleotide-binding universal stress UspA family protein
MLPIRTVLHATDFSESCAAAFRLACSLARDYGARLIVLHVQPPTMGFGEMGGFTLVPEGHSEELMHQLRQLRPDDPAVVVDYRLVEGDAAEEILRTARETNTDVIVLGTHGRKGLGRLLLGSVAEQTVRTAPCPVVPVKPAPRSIKPRTRATPKGTAEAPACRELVRQ